MRTEAQQRAQRAYYARKREDPEFIERQRAAGRRHYERTKNIPEVKEAKRQYMKEYWQRTKNDPDAQRKRVATRRKHYLAKYGLTPDDFARMSEQQQDACAVCRSVRPLSVDHCHRTGRVRGLLCHPCNVALGFLQEDVQIMQALINYTAQS